MTQFYNNQYGNQPYPQQQQYGAMNYNARPIIQPKMTQQSKDEIELLRRDGESKFSLALTDLEMTRSGCPHRENGRLTYTDNADGTVTCSICRETFNLVDASAADVGMKVADIIDVLQSVKALHLDIPEDVLRSFMPIIEMLKKVPRLYEMAVNTFQKYDVPIHQNANDQYGFSQFANIMGAGFGMPPMQMPQYPAYGQQPYMGQMQQQPMGNYGQQPQFYQQPQTGYGVGNPFGNNGGDPTMYQQPQYQQAPPSYQTAPVNIGQPVDPSMIPPQPGAPTLESTKTYQV